MAKARLPESTRVGAGLSSPVLWRALHCTTNSRCVLVEPGARWRRIAHTRGRRRVRRVRALFIGLTGTDRIVAVEMMTFSADKLRTGGGSVNAGRACGVPAVWSASRSLATLLRAQHSTLVSHPRRLYWRGFLERRLVGALVAAGLAAVSPAAFPLASP